jgi:recombination protein RecA
VQKSGSFFSYGEQRLGQGRNNVKQHLTEHPELTDEIEGLIFERIGIDRPAKPERRAAEDEPTAVAAKADAKTDAKEKAAAKPKVEAVEDERKAA